jgi:microcystin-dependent protein
MSEPFIAEIRMFAGSFAPKGHANCDGQLLPINQNQALFALVGTTYGGNGTTTFALPDLRGRVPVHKGQGPGLPLYSLGEKGGSETVTLSQAQVPPHSHPLLATTAQANVMDPTGNALAKARSPVYAPPGANPELLHGDTVADTGGGVPHSNMQPFLTLRFIIALVGIFPSQS